MSQQDLTQLPNRIVQWEIAPFQINSDAIVFAIVRDGEELIAFAIHRNKSWIHSYRRPFASEIWAESDIMTDYAINEIRLQLEIRHGRVDDRISEIAWYRKLVW